jgi:hypothetical protein
MNLGVHHILAIIALVFAVLGLVPFPNWSHSNVLLAIAVILLAISALIP